MAIFQFAGDQRKQVNSSFVASDRRLLPRSDLDFGLQNGK